MSHRALSHSIFFLLGVAVFVGCSAEGGFLGDLAGSPDDGDDGASLPPPSGGSSGGSSSGSGGADAGNPKKADAAGEDAGPPAPRPGDACATNDEIFKRPCGACGWQEALCLAGKVSDYGACLGEKVGGCVPGSVGEDSCGNCGKLTKTCTKYCEWQKTTCSGEPASSCPAGTIAWATSGCASGVTKRTCSDVCQWSSFTGQCSAPDYSVKVATVAGKSASVVFPLIATQKTKKVTGKCTSGATLSPTDQHVVAYVRVQNDNAAAAKVSAWNSLAPGGSVIDTVLTAYAAIPSGDDGLRACIGAAGTSCAIAKLPCGDAKFGALTDATAVTIPAGQSRIIAVTTEQVHQAGNTVEGPIMLTVRTDSLE